MHFSAKQRCLIIKLYYANNKSYARVRAQFSEEYLEIELIRDPAHCTGPPEDRHTMRADASVTRTSKT